MKQFLFTFFLLIIGNINWGLSQPVQRNIRTQEYKQLQEDLCKGWNTWYNNSIISHVLLPEGFSINLCIATIDNRNYLKETFKASSALRRPENVSLGLRSDDGSYTSMTLTYKDTRVAIETATEGKDIVILVSPEQPSENLIVAEAGILFDKEGQIGKNDNVLIGKFLNEEIQVGATEPSITSPYLSTTSPRLNIQLKQKVGFYTGKVRTLSEIQNIINKGKKVQLQRAEQYGALKETFLPMQNILAWNTIYDAANHRAITPVSRNWNQGWGGYVLFDWDTYFAAYMFSLFNKELAYANAIEITKAITPEGFVPNFQSVSGYKPQGNTSSWDRSQPPVGSKIVLEIYKKYKEKWFLQEVYDELLTWNRWWVNRRAIGKYLAWGSRFEKNGKTITEGLQGAMYESGLDNSPMYDNIPMNPQTHTMELADVGLISMYVMDCNALAEIAKILKKDNDFTELKKRAKFYGETLQSLWSEDTGFFLNKRTDTKEFSHTLSPTNFYPMLAEVCSSKQVKRMLKEHYYNPNEFYGEYVLPSIAKNSPGFSDNDYWRGRIWGPLNFLVYLGMRNYDIKEARLDLIQKSKNLLLKNWKENGGIFENYNSVNGKGEDVQNADGFYHWGALLSFMEFIEAGYL